MNNEEIAVSICCLVYNHEKYLRKCLDGFITQKTTFRYEVLIHDDASTDKSAEIIREYELKYPDIIKPIYQRENQYTKGVKIGYFYQYPRAKGRYLAFCEGDDYWCDESKLQKQFEALEEHKDCYFCTHVVKVAVNDKVVSLVPESNRFKQGIVDKETVFQALLGGYPFQTSSFFMRKEILEPFFYKPEKYMYTKHGDMALMFTYAIRGDFYFIDEKLSVYRKGTEYSWTKERKRNINTLLEDIDDSRNFYYNFDQFTMGKYHEELFEMVRKYEFDYAMYSKDFSTVYKSEYEELLKKFSFKARIFMRACILCPVLKKLWKDYL